MIELRIVLDDAGNVQVSGNVDATYHCYAMMEVARDVIYKRSVERDAAIKPATPGDMLALRRTNHQ